MCFFTLGFRHVWAKFSPGGPELWRGGNFRCCCCCVGGAWILGDFCSASSPNPLFSSHLNFRETGDFGVVPPLLSEITDISALPSKQRLSFKTPCVCVKLSLLCERPNVNLRFLMRRNSCCYDPPEKLRICVFV